MSHYLKRAFLPLVATLLTVVTPANTPDAQTATGFRIYYGKDSEKLTQIEEEMTPGQVIVLDSRVVEPDRMRRLIKRAHDTKAKVLTYISVGELAEYELPQFLAFVRNDHKEEEAENVLESLTIARNNTFHSRHVDVLNESWRAFILARAKTLLASGVDGLFLDTVDTVDVYASKKDWSLQRRASSVTAMISLVRQIKSQWPTRYILQNRGLNLIGPKVFVGDATGIEIAGMEIGKRHAANPDGILFENAFGSQDAWSMLRIKQLKAARDATSVDIFALGYEDAGLTKSYFFPKAKSQGFVAAWATSSKKLGEEVTALPPQ